MKDEDDSDDVVPIGGTWWTPDKEKCFDFFMAGWPKTQIAAKIERHRNVITRWCSAKPFQERVAERRQDNEATVRQRRVHETNLFADRIARLASKALDKAETKPDDAFARNTAREWLSEYKSFRDQERVDLGDNIQKHEHAIAGQVSHTHAISQSSFKGFLEGAIASGAIDAECVEGDAHSMITALTQQALLETDLLDQLAEADREAAMGDDPMGIKRK